VVIVLHQLEQIQDIATFKTYIAEFADASGDMWTLYARVLSKFEDNVTQQTWVQEILKWAVVSEKITVDQLQAIVEWSLQNRLADFKRFLEVECGALIDLIPVSGSSELTVHLVHETLRTFLVSSKSCPSQFHVDEKRAHSYACSILLDILSAEDASAQRTSYASDRWVDHLEESNTEIQCYDVLEKLYRFLHSPGCKTWILKAILRNHRLYSFQIEIRFDELSLRIVWKYIQRCGASSAASSAKRWRSELVKSPAKLGEQIGQWAAKIWLHEDNNWETAKAAFCLALKYYCKKHRHQTDDIEKLQKLAADDFSGISTEFGDPGRPVKRPNLGVGFLVLHLWFDAVQCYQGESNVPCQMGEAYLRLGELCAKDGDFSRAIELFAKASELDNETAPIMLGAVYQSVGKYCESIKTLENIDTKFRDPSCTSALHILLHGKACYALSKNIPGEIEEILCKYPQWWARQYIEEAKSANDDSEQHRELYEGYGRENETSGLHTGKFCERTQVNVHRHEY